jgi:hypothetical protein
MMQSKKTLVIAAMAAFLVPQYVMAKPAKMADLQDLIGYSDIKNCQLRAPFVDSLKTLTKAMDNEGPLPEVQVEDRYRSAFGAPQVIDDSDNVWADIPMNGTWRGLTLTTLQVYPSEAGPMMAFLFKAPMNKVIAAMKRDGITFGPPNKEMDGARSGKQAPFYVSVEPDKPGVTRLICSWI